MSTRMMSRTRRPKRAVPPSATARTAALAVVLALVGPAAASGQSIWYDPVDPPRAWLEVMRPTLDEQIVGADGLTTTSSAWFVGGRFHLSPGLRLVAEVPFAHGEPESAPLFGGGTTALGNPYVGLEHVGDGGPVWFEVGARLPLAPEDNFGGLVGLVADPVDRMEAFATDVLPITAAVNYQRGAGSGFQLRLRASTAGWIPTGGGDGDLLVGYGGQAGYRGGGLRIVGGISGRAVLTESDVSFGERTVHQAGATVALRMGGVEPGFHVRLPLDDDLRQLHDVTWGLSVAVPGLR